MMNGPAEGLLGVLGRRETPESEVDAPQTAGRRRSEDRNKKKQGEKV